MENSSDIDATYVGEQNGEVLLATLTPYPLLKRGPMYQTYSQKREQRLREKRAEQAANTPPTKKKVSFELSSPCSGQSSTTAVARSVPDLSAILRKENKSPNVRAVATPPSGGAKSKKGSQIGKSAGGFGKKVGGGSRGVIRSSCASLTQLKSLSRTVASAIDEEGRRTSRMVLKRNVG